MSPSSADAHLYATDVALFADRLLPGADLYGTDAQLYGAAGDARLAGPDLWASDRALFATREDRAQADLRRLRAALRARARCASDGIDASSYGQSYTVRGDGNADTRGSHDSGGRALAPSVTCSICLGEMPATAAAAAGGAGSTRVNTRTTAAAAAAARWTGGEAREAEFPEPRDATGAEARDGDGDGDGDGGDGRQDDGRNCETVETPCGHRYHVRCILAAVDAIPGGDSCPVCRRPMLDAFDKLE